MSIINELERIRAGKEELRLALLAKGAVLTEGALIDEYAAAVNSISVGGSELPEATWEVVANEVKITAGSIGDTTITIPTGRVSIIDDSISIDAGYVFDDIVDLPTTRLRREGDTVYASRGWIAEEEAWLTIPAATLTTSGGSVVVSTEGYVKKDYKLTLPTTTLRQDGPEFSVDVGWVSEFKSIELPYASVQETDTAITVTPGYLDEAITVEKPTQPATGRVYFDANRGAVIGVAGYIEDYEEELSRVYPTLSGNVFTITKGWVDDTYTEEVPYAEITETETSVTIGVGYVAEAKTYQLSTGDTTSIRFGVVDEDGKFQPLDVAVAPPTLEGVGEDGEYYILETGLPYPEEPPSAPSTGGGNAEFVLVDEYIAHKDAYSAVDSIVVTGFGEVDVWGEMMDYSAWNGNYQVTPETAGATNTEGRTYKHISQNKYLRYGEDFESEDGYLWGFYTSENSTISKYYADFWSYELTSGTWSNYETDAEVSLTIALEEVDYPEQPLVLNGYSVSYAEGEFNPTTTPVAITSYDESPIEQGVYLTHDSKLIGNPIKFARSDYNALLESLKGYFVDENWPFRNVTLKMHFNMDDKNDRVVDRVSGATLLAAGGCRYSADGINSGCWINEATSGSYLSGYSPTGYGIGGDFTLIAYIFIPEMEPDYAGTTIVEFGAHQRGTGFGLRLGYNNSAGERGVYLRVGDNEEGSYHPAVKQGVWHMIACTWREAGDHFNLHFYVDGVLEHQGEWASHYAIKDDKFMAMFSRAGLNETGVDHSSIMSIDDVYLYDGALDGLTIASMADILASAGNLAIKQHNILFGNAVSTTELYNNCVVTASTLGSDAAYKLFSWGTQSVEVGGPGSWVAIDMPNFSKISGVGICNVGGGNIWLWRTCVLQGLDASGNWNDIQTLTGSESATGWGEEQYFDVTTSTYYHGYRFVFTKSIADNGTGNMRIGALHLYSGTKEA